MTFPYGRSSSLTPVSGLLLCAALAACADRPGAERITASGDVAASRRQPLPPPSSIDSLAIPTVPLREGSTVAVAVRVRIEALGATMGASAGASTGAPTAREFAGVRVQGAVRNGVAVARGTVTDPSGQAIPLAVRLAERAGGTGGTESGGAIRRVLRDAQGVEVVVTETPGEDGSPRARLQVTRGGQLVSELTQRWRRVGETWLLQTSTMTAYHAGRPVSRVTVTLDGAPTLAAARPADGAGARLLGGVTRALAAALLPSVAHASPLVGIAAAPAAVAAASCYWRFLALAGEGALVAGACGGGLSLACAVGSLHLYNELQDWAKDCT